MEQGAERNRLRAGRTRSSVAVAGGFVVIAAAVAAPQFVLSPELLTGLLLGGLTVGMVVVFLTRVVQPSRVFLLLLVPLVFLGFSALPDATSLSRPALLVGLSAFTIGGALTERYATTR